AADGDSRWCSVVNHRLCAAVAHARCAISTSARNAFSNHVNGVVARALGPRRCSSVLVGLWRQSHCVLIRRMRSLSYLKVLAKCLSLGASSQFWAATLTAQTQNQIVGAVYDIPASSAVAAPGQVITLRVQRLNVPDAKATSIPLPTMLSGVGIRVTTQTPNYPEHLPIFSIVSSDYCGGISACPLTYIT